APSKSTVTCRVEPQQPFDLAGRLVGVDRAGHVDVHDTCRAADAPPGRHDGILGDEADTRGGVQVERRTIGRDRRGYGRSLVSRAEQPADPAANLFQRTHFVDRFLYPPDQCFHSGPHYVDWPFHGLPGADHDGAHTVSGTLDDALDEVHGTLNLGSDS